MQKRVAIEPGTVFGYLTVVNHLGSNKHGQAMYGCACTACGKRGLPVPGYKLRRGEVKSCGCKRAELRLETKAKAANLPDAGAAGDSVFLNTFGESAKQIGTIGDTEPAQGVRSNRTPGDAS